MKGYLLDTCICVFLFRRKHGIDKRLKGIDVRKCYISEVTIAELKYGAYKSDRVAENLLLIENLISRVNVVNFAESIDFFARKKNDLRKKGLTIEDFDLLIASAAITKNLVLVTDNTKHFQRIEGLTLENWVER